MDPLSAAAAQVAKKRAELEQRLAELHAARLPHTKLQLAPLVIATMYELLDHQDRFNSTAVQYIGELFTRCELLAAKTGCAFATAKAPNA